MSLEHALARQTAPRKRGRKPRSVDPERLRRSLADTFRKRRHFWASRCRAWRTIGSAASSGSNTRSSGSVDPVSALDIAGVVAGSACGTPGRGRAVAQEESLGPIERSEAPDISSVRSAAQRKATSMTDTPSAPVAQQPTSPRVPADIGGHPEATAPRPCRPQPGGPGKPMAPAAALQSLRRDRDQDRPWRRAACRPADLRWLLPIPHVAE